MALSNESLFFLTHAIKQYVFGFEQLDRDADELDDGSAAKAFYLTSIYHYLAVFYLLDKDLKKAPRGGSLFKVLRPHALEHHLDPAFEILDRPIDRTTIGDLILKFRNKAIVHTNHNDKDLDAVYLNADMQEPRNIEKFQQALFDIFYETKLLPVRLIQEHGLPLEDFGIRLG